MKTIEFFYSAHSAFAYIGFRRMVEIADAANRRIIHRPIYLNKIVASANDGGFGNRSKAHRAYYFGREIDRWAQYRGVEMGNCIPSNHANDTTLANCLLIAASEEKLDVNGLAFGLLSGHWVDHVDLADKEQLATILQKQGLDAGALFAKAKSEAILNIYRRNTAEAIERSVFGSPTYVVDGDMFYGQDHLELVERALRQPFEQNWR